MIPETELICPVCRELLTRNGAVYGCTRGHSFDVAREGYVNLLVGKAPGALQGDSGQMVRARRAFLGRGIYQPLAAAVAKAVSGVKPRVVADFGSGEGYYLHELSQEPLLKGAKLYGMDISKPAIVMAAKAYPEVTFIVADTNRLLPFADASVDAGMCVFAPRNPGEFARVVRPGGRLVVVIPGLMHLAALRERYGLLGIELDKIHKIQTQLSAFTLTETHHVTMEKAMGGEALAELVEMTPNARHVDEAKRAGIGAEAEMLVGLEFEVLVFTR